MVEGAVGFGGDDNDSEYSGGDDNRNCGGAGGDAGVESSQVCSNFHYFCKNFSHMLSSRRGSVASFLTLLYFSSLLLSLSFSNYPSSHSFPLFPFCFLIRPLLNSSCLLYILHSISSSFLSSRTYFIHTFLPLALTPYMILFFLLCPFSNL